MRGYAQRVFHVAPGTLDAVGPELTGEERDERIARRLCGWLASAELLAIEVTLRGSISLTPPASSQRE